MNKCCSDSNGEKEKVKILCRAIFDMRGNICATQPEGMAKLTMDQQISLMRCYEKRKINKIIAEWSKNEMRT